MIGVLRISLWEEKEDVVGAERWWPGSCRQVDEGERGGRVRGWMVEEQGQQDGCTW